MEPKALRDLYNFHGIPAQWVKCRPFKSWKMVFEAYLIYSERLTLLEAIHLMVDPRLRTS